MKVIASQLPESILCTLPNGEQIEVTMLCSEGDDCFAEPSIEAAINLVMKYLDFEDKL